MIGVGFGVVGGILLVVLAIGVLLPGEWAADASTVIAAPPEEVHPHLERAASWTEWTPSPESGYEYFGPEEGEGSGRRWDDPGYGSGEFVVTRSDPPVLVEYEVEVEEGSIRIRGRLEVEPADGGSRIRWREEGDFGWNPLLGYVAGRMQEMQAEQLGASLEALDEALADDDAGSPSSIGSPGSSGAAARSSSFGA